MNWINDMQKMIRFFLLILINSEKKINNSSLRCTYNIGIYLRMWGTRKYNIFGEDYDRNGETWTRNRIRGY